MGGTPGVAAGAPAAAHHRGEHQHAGLHQHAGHGGDVVPPTAGPGPRAGRHHRASPWLIGPPRARMGGRGPGRRPPEGRGLHQQPGPGRGLPSGGDRRAGRQPQGRGALRATRRAQRSPAGRRQPHLVPAHACAGTGGGGRPARGRRARQHRGPATADALLRCAGPVPGDPGRRRRLRSRHHLPRSAQHPLLPGPHARGMGLAAHLHHHRGQEPAGL